MKKILFGTTALATAALLSAGAQAADDGLKLTISGFYNGTVIAGDDDASDHRNVTFENDGEIIFTAEGTAANGLTYGFTTQLEATTSGDQIDEAYLYLSGGFGRFEFGNTNGAAAKMSYAAPMPDKVGFLGVNSPTYWPQGNGANLTTVTTYNVASGDAFKASYFTPRLGGFQFGVSYTPDSCADGSSAGGLATGLSGGSTGCTTDGGFELDNQGVQGQVVEAGLNFSKEFSGITLGLSGTYAWVEYEDTGVALVDAGTDDMTVWNLGANVGFGLGAGTLTVGGSYQHADSALLVDDLDYDAYDAGVQYAQGPWTVGIQYVHGEWDNDVAEEKTWVLGVGGGYTVATGLDVSLGYMHVDNSGDFSDDPVSDLFILGTQLSF